MAYFSTETHTKLMSFHYLKAGDLSFLKTYHKPIFYQYFVYKDYLIIDSITSEQHKMKK